ncbi:MAG: DNA-processing protein DprA [Spirochaetales bacterium]|nr:DNA-processing protein DprA [Spirochaetales bacterium]
MEFIDFVLFLNSIPGLGIHGIKKIIYENRGMLGDLEFCKYLIEVNSGIHFNRLKVNVDRIKSLCDKLGVTIIRGENYPIYNSPLLLFTKGDRSLLEVEKIISVAGTRNPSDLGIKIGEEIISHIVKSKWVTISGLANGCDKLAHKTTIESGGVTIAVLPYGYRKDVAPWILNNGLIISEYPPYSSQEKYKCIHRNRIIAGLSKLLYVIESNKDSGSEHTMKYATYMNIPIIYSLGFTEICNYSNNKVITPIEFDLFTKNL